MRERKKREIEKTEREKGKSPSTIYTIYTPPIEEQNPQGPKERSRTRPCVLHTHVLYSPCSPSPHSPSSCSLFPTSHSSRPPPPHFPHLRVLYSLFPIPPILLSCYSAFPPPLPPLHPVLNSTPFSKKPQRNGRGRRKRPGCMPLACVSNLRGKIKRLSSQTPLPKDHGDEHTSSEMLRKREEILGL